jgi:hypothetical protein
VDDGALALMWFCPTRHRPLLAQRMLDACIDTDMQSRGLVLIDGEGQDYAALQPPQNWAVLATGTHLELCGVLQRAFALYPDEPFYGIISDDDVPRTRGWDRALETEAGRWYMASAYNLHMAPPRLGAGAFGGELIRAMGFWALPGLVHLYSDDVWEHIGHTLDLIRFRADVLIEHLHFSNGKAPFDATYERTYQGVAFGPKDRAIFETWRDRDAAAVLQRIHARMEADHALRS